MSFVIGKNVLLEFYDGGTWKPYACARSCSYTTTTELIETSVAGSGKFKHFLPTVNSFNGTCDGITSLGNVGMITLPMLRNFQLGHVKQRIRFTRGAMNGTDFYNDEIEVFITSIQDVNSFDNVSTFDVTFQGIGEPDQTLINPPIIVTNVKRYEYTVIGGETNFADFAVLVNKDVIYIDIDGIGRAELISVGAPVGRQVKYVAAAGAITWPVDLALDAGVIITVIYQDI